MADASNPPPQPALPDWAMTWMKMDLSEVLHQMKVITPTPLSVSVALAFPPFALVWLGDARVPGLMHGYYVVVATSFRECGHCEKDHAYLGLSRVGLSPMPIDADAFYTRASTVTLISYAAGLKPPAVYQALYYLLVNDATPWTFESVAALWADSDDTHSTQQLEMDA